MDFELPTDKADQFESNLHLKKKKIEMAVSKNSDWSSCLDLSGLWTANHANATE